MRIEGDPIPFRAAQAYGVPAVPHSVRVDPIRPVQRQTGPAQTTRLDAPEVKVAPTKIDRLVGAVVPGGIDFTDVEAKPSEPRRALPFYTRPGQRNEAATSIIANTGRTIDVRG